jgi:biopolymer transport protein TolR
MTQAGPTTSASSGPSLSPAQRSKIRRLAAPKDPEPGEEAGELNVVPYLDIIVNILVFVLSSLSVTFLTQLDTTPPSMGSGKVKQEMKSEALNLSVLITNKGVAFKTSFGSVATGCDGQGGGITVPTKGSSDSDYDLPAITKCARKLKSEAGGGKFEEESQVTVTASRDIEYKHLIAVIDALRNDEKGELFDDFHLGVAK